MSGTQKAFRRAVDSLLIVLCVCCLVYPAQSSQDWVPDGGGAKNAPRQIPPPWPPDSRVVVYPAPDGEELSADWTVEVTALRTFRESPIKDWRPVPVYTARVNDPPFTHLDHGGTYSIAYFDFSGVVTVKIHSDFVRDYRLEQTRMMPLSMGIRHSTIDMNTTSFVLDRPAKLFFGPEGRRHALLIFANPLEADAPKEGDPNVIYFGPGIHRPASGIVQVKSKQTLYIAGGAILQAAVAATDAEDVSIRGRGILDGTPWPHGKGPTRRLVSLRMSKRVTVDGIIVRGSYGWTIVLEGSENVSITNVKICNGRVINDDGINPVNSRHVLIRDCFIRTDDDCIAIKGLQPEWGDVDDLRVEHSILWGDRARVTLFAHESRAENMQNIVFRDIDILHFVQTPFLFEPGDDMVIQNVRFEDIRLNGAGQGVLVVLRPTVNQFMKKNVAGHIRNIHFKNVQVVGAPGKYAIVMEGYDEKHAVDNVTLENVTILGTPLTDSSPNLRVGKHVTGVKVIPATAAAGR